MLRDGVYLPIMSDALLVPITEADDEIFKHKIAVVKSLITELEDENNLIAYKIAKTRRRIEEKQARLAEQQAPAARGFWGGRKTATSATAVDEKPAVSGASGGGSSRKPAGAAVGGASSSNRKRDRSKAKSRPSGPVSVEEAIPPLTTTELTYLETGLPPAAAEPSRKSGHAKRESQSSKSRRPAARDPDDMDVDDFDDY